tara:strand:+ start:445 stop:801 length:357 start_codon:yes stop_codon:yes gene_type:complete
LLVASGGAIGASFRFIFINIIKYLSLNTFISTALVNIIGSFLIGYLISLSHTKNIHEDFLKYFLIIGLLGSYTTFSTFSYEIIDMMIAKKFLLSLCYILFSIFLCLSATFFGLQIHKV